MRDVDVAGAHLGDRVERHQEVVVVLELLADELLGLVLVRRDEPRLGLDARGAAARPRRRARRAPRAASSRAPRRRRSPRRRRAAASRRRRPSRRRARGSGASRAGSRARPRETFGPHSLISVYVPAVGSTTAVEVRDSSLIRTKSLRIASSVSSSTIRVPVRPPARPVATTGTSSRLSARATLIPLPPASASTSLARCRCPSLKIGTVSERSSAALRVTVTITAGDPFRDVDATRRARRDGGPCGGRTTRAFPDVPTAGTDSAATSGGARSACLPRTRAPLRPLAPGYGQRQRRARRRRARRAAGRRGRCGRRSSRGDELDRRAAVAGLGEAVDAAAVDRLDPVVLREAPGEEPARSAFRCASVGAPSTAAVMRRRRPATAATCDQPASSVCPVLPRPAAARRSGRRSSRASGRRRSSPSSASTTSG